MRSLEFTDLPAVLREHITDWKSLGLLLESNYGEPWRHYHNLKHVSAMLEQVERLGALIIDPAAMCVAILFHDIVYDVQAKSGENERLSAGVADVYAPLYTQRVNLERVASLIMATYHTGNTRGHDEQIIADIDLSSFTHPYVQFRAGSQAVIEEYCTAYPELDVLKGRVAFLQSMLKKQRIFYTDFFDESAARKNIVKEIAYLSDKLDRAL